MTPNHNTNTLELLDVMEVDPDRWSCRTIMVLLRAFIRLVGDTPSGDNAAIATRIAHIAGFDPSAFTRAEDHHRGASRIAPADAGGVLAGCLSGLERLNAFLDSFTTQAGTHIIVGLRFSFRSCSRRADTMLFNH